MAKRRTIIHANPFQKNFLKTNPTGYKYLRQYRTEIVRILRRQIFRQIVQIERRRADARQAKFVQDDGKYASKMRTKP